MKKEKRKIKDNEQMLSLIIDKDLVVKIKDIKQKKGISLRFQIQEALKEYIKSHD